MKVFCIAVSQHGKPAKTLIAQFDLSSFSFFQRGTVQEAMGFFLGILVERTAVGTRHTVQEQSYTGHTYVRSDGLAASIIWFESLIIATKNTSLELPSAFSTR
jgi:synaptobrevin homolog YKT6